MAILFHNEDIGYTIRKKQILKKWISACISAENKVCGEINVILCSDNYLHSMNVEFLQHDYLTDIITFDYTEQAINGDLYISIDRVKDNAHKHEVSTENELQRVIIHGVMHLCGFKDKSKKDAAHMRNQEEKCLEKLAKNLSATVSRGTQKRTK